MLKYKDIVNMYILNRVKLYVVCSKKFFEIYIRNEYFKDIKFKIIYNRCFQMVMKNKYVMK